MADIISTEERSLLMSKIKGTKTKPEDLIGKMLYSKGYRYRRNVQSLPGKPDFVLKKWKAVIFVHGCFWHGHSCNLFKYPKTNEKFWKAKIDGNKIRDEKSVNALLKQGWRVLIVWECCIRKKQLSQIGKVANRCSAWLQSNEQFKDID